MIPPAIVRWTAATMTISTLWLLVNAAMVSSSQSTMAKTTTTEETLRRRELYEPAILRHQKHLNDRDVVSPPYDPYDFSTISDPNDGNANDQGEGGEGSTDGGGGGGLISGVDDNCNDEEPSVVRIEVKGPNSDGVFGVPSLLEGGGTAEIRGLLGVTSFPDDRLMPDACSQSEDFGEGNMCVNVDGGMLIFVVDGMNPTEADEAAVHIMRHVHDNMDRDVYIDLEEQPDIKRVTFVTSTIQSPDAGGDDRDIDSIQGGTNDAVNGLPFIMIGVGAALLGAMLLLVMRRRRRFGDVDDDDDYDDPRDKELDKNGEITDLETSIAPSSTEADLTMASSTSFTNDSMTMGSFEQHYASSSPSSSTPTTSPTNNLLSLTPMLGQFEDDGQDSLGEDDEADDELLFSPVNKDHHQQHRGGMSPEQQEDIPVAVEPPPIPHQGEEGFDDHEENNVNDTSSIEGEGVDPMRPNMDEAPPTGEAPSEDGNGRARINTEGSIRRVVDAYENGDDISIGSF